MIITLVTDQFFQSNHGTSVSAQWLYQGLVKQGHVVRILTIDDGTNTPYALNERSFGKPIDRVIHSQGMQLAKPDKEIILKAIRGADVVHVFMPFKLGYKTIELCRERNIPCTAAFHIAPENITSTLHLNKFKFINYLLWKRWYRKVYQYVEHIHCPSEMINKQLNEHCFNTCNHVISNGYKDIFKMQREEKPTIYKDKFIIVVNGRFSREKRFDLVINAINKSKYRERILLILGGKGPQKKRLMRLARKLPVYPVFLGSYNREQQLSFLNFADLYIHPADVEIEGMTCIEAIACGCVPIVSDSPKSATSQFVLHKRSSFRHGNYKDLAENIDWWIEHPNDLQAHRTVIAKHALNFTIERSMRSYIEMFDAVVSDRENVYDLGTRKVEFESSEEWIYLSNPT
ncbi:MAG: glycosyltransferase [Clostridia bacterium]|nr:glycosyltransferase [Clostridia bacterium]